MNFPIIVQAPLDASLKALLKTQPTLDARLFKPPPRRSQTVAEGRSGQGYSRQPKYLLLFRAASTAPSRSHQAETQTDAPCRTLSPLPAPHKPQPETPKGKAEGGQPRPDCRPHHATTGGREFFPTSCKPGEPFARITALAWSTRKKLGRPAYTPQPSAAFCLRATAGRVIVRCMKERSANNRRNGWSYHRAIGVDNFPESIPMTAPMAHRDTG